jgi:hypothetical protein
VKTRCLIFALSNLALATSAAAQTTAEAPPSEDSSVTAKTLSNRKGHSDSDVQASPDVQEQVGIGTEKEESKRARAKAPPPTERTSQAPTPKEEPESDPYGHQMQFGARVGVLLGYRMPFRYDKSPFCEKPDKTDKVSDQKKICGFGAPPALDVALSFAPLDGVEPYIWGRFGLSAESRTDTKALRVFGVGARIYTSSESRFKFFFEPALGYEVEEGRGHADYRYVQPPDGESFVPNYKKDIFFHVAFGPQYDFMRYFGLYLNLGANVGVLRYLNTTLEGQVGLQVRAP